MIRKNFGDHFGDPITMKNVCTSEEAATKELRKMLKIGADAVMKEKCTKNSGTVVKNVVEIGDS